MRMNEGLDPRLLARSPGYTVMTKDSKICRDRIPWGGVTETDSCSCKGACRYDLEKTRRSKEAL